MANGGMLLGSTVIANNWNIEKCGNIYFGNDKASYVGLLSGGGVYCSGKLYCQGNFEVNGTTTFTGGAYFINAMKVTASTSTPNARLTTGSDYGRLALVASSSIRYKNLHNKVSSKDVNDLFNIPVHWFTYKEEYLGKDDERYNKQVPGFVVEDWEKVMPIAIDHLNDGRPEMWNSNIVTPLMFEMIKSNREIINKQEQRIATLEKQI